MLKRYDISLFTILMLLLAASLLSCEKESDDPASDKAPIKFGDVETRAVVESEESMKTGGFGVFGYVSDVTDPLFDNVNVTWDADKKVWTYGDPKYWIPSHTHHFFAYYPYSTATTADSGVSGVQALDDNSGFKLNFTTPATADCDLLTAYTTVDTGADNFDASDHVALAFTHALVNVNLNIWRDGGKHQNDQMRIKKVTLSNIRKGGTYSSNTYLWALTNEKLTLEKEYEGGSDNDNIGAATMENGKLTTGGTAANPFNNMMLIPQTLDRSSPVSLRIQYELKRQNAANWEQAELETVLPNVIWEANRRYTYNVVLSSVTDITVYYIQTKVDPWGTPQVGGTVIIK